MGGTGSGGLLVPDEVRGLREDMARYRCALRVVQTTIDNIDDYFTSRGDANPIEHVKYRIKSPESIAGKLLERGLPLTARSATENLSDIAGARIICSYAKDIAWIAETLKEATGLQVLSEKDYVAAPKPSGYRSYHMIVAVDTGSVFAGQQCRVEIQIRTAAMDFWASLEHKVRYKHGGVVPEHLNRELQVCAEKIHELDDRMYLIHELVELVNE